MMLRLSGPVGERQPNKSADVMAVQSLLNRNIHLLTPYRFVDESGRYDELTRDLVMEFQRRVVKLKQPDAVIGPNGPTWRALNSHTASTTAPPPAPKTSAPAGGLTNAEYVEAARVLNCEAAAIRAVAFVETKRSPFDEQGRPTILFERHIFHERTGGKFAKDHPDLSNPVGGGYGKYSEQYGKLERAKKLDDQAAKKSCSWGAFQIMGFNHQDAGFASVDLFVKAMERSVSEHLKAFVNFIKADSVKLKALQQKDWTSFAKRYNGAGYKKNDYDTKMKTAYEQFSKEEKATASSSSAVGG